MSIKMTPATTAATTTKEKLKQAAVEYLAKAFNDGKTTPPPSHMVQAAVAIVLSQEPPRAP